MFDFLNYTYSGVLSVLSTLFGLAYPLILGCIEKIDTKYHSTKLSSRFYEENVFKAFKCLLIINLVIAVLFPFIMDGCEHSRYLMALQCIAAVVMIYYAFRLFSMIMVYYDAALLQNHILADYHTSVASSNSEAESKYFTQWSDLTSVLLSSADEQLVQSVYQEWFNYVDRKYEASKGEPLEMDDYFYDAVTLINENLCKGERKPISVNNGNSLLTSLIFHDSIVAEKTYWYLWKNLRLQLYFDRDEWIMAYWKSASQKYELFMRDISIFDIDGNSGKNYTERQVEERNRQREKFQEFHIMLCAMLLQQGKYELLEQMLFYTQSQPPSYPLVPSSLASILDSFEYLNKDRFLDITYFEQRYPMPNMHGITGGKIVGAANCFMALLVYRLYVLDYPYGRESVFRAISLPNNQAQLAKYKRDLGILNNWLEKIKDNNEALAAIRLKDIDELFDTSKSSEKDPRQIITEILTTVDNKLSYLKQHQPNDPSIVDNYEKEVSRRLQVAMSPLEEILGKRFQRDTGYNLNSSINQLFPSTAFQENPDIGYGGIEESMFEGLWHNFIHFLASSFYQERMRSDYTIDSGLLFDALDRLAVDKNNFAIAFGIYLDFFMSKVEGLVKVQDRIYSYKGMKILLLDGPTQLFSKRLYVMKYDDRPYIVFQEPSDELKQNMGLKKFNGYDLWLSIQKVQGNEEQIPEKKLRELGDEKNSYSMFHAMWMPKIFFKDQYERICLKVNYRSTDEGRTDSLDKIKPFDNKQPEE